jgi:hypothetical protein
MVRAVECERTGRFRVRRNWFGKLILQMECKMANSTHLQGQFSMTSFWRDATEKDILMFRGTSSPFKVD